MHLFDADDQALPRCADTADQPLPAAA